MPPGVQRRSHAGLGRSRKVHLRDVIGEFVAARKVMGRVKDPAVTTVSLPGV
jgi:hypothetical protein